MPERISRRASSRELLLGVIDTTSHAVSATIPTGGAAPRDIAFTQDGAFAYVGHVFSPDVAVIDTAALKVVKTVVIAATHSDGIAHRPGRTETYIVSQGSAPILRILDRTTNTIVDEVPIDGVTLGDVEFVDDASRAYITDANAVHVFDASTRTVIATIPGTRGGDIEIRPPTPVINQLVEVSVTQTSCCVGEKFVITGVLTNTSAVAIPAPFFQVTTLTEGNLLANADYAPGGVGATLTPDVGDDGVLSPGESRTVMFVIDLNTGNPFHFLVDIRGRTP
jgi:YVTN family beta-propeller protein